MSSKIKVDTIENVAGSGNVSLGSGHNLVVPGTSTLTGGVTSSAAHTVTTTTHANASVFKSTGNTQIMLQDTDASANDQFWGLQNSGGEFNILTCNDDRASGFVTPMTITQAGQVVKPNQPSWFQYVIGSGTFSSGWKNVPLNPNASTAFPYHIAGGVTTANGNHEVTVPVAGHYQINGAVTLDAGSVNTDGTLTLSKNNSTMGGGQSSGVYNGALGGTTISYVVELAANDTVGLDYYFSGSATYRNTQYAGYFSGYLLG